MQDLEIVVPQPMSEVDAAIFLVRASDKASSMTRELLYRIKSQNLSEGRFSSFKEFVESPDGLGKTYSWAVKQIKVYEHYVLQGGIPQFELENIDNERLYLAKQLPESVNAQLEKAQSLSRSEIRDELASTPEADCQHGYPTVTICSHCNKRVAVYDPNQTN